MEFTYTAITKAGQKETSSIQAPNITAAGHILKEQGLLLTHIEEQQKKSVVDFLRNISTVSLDEKINFVENLSVMLKAGISISRGLQIQVKQTKNVKFKNILTDIYNQVEQGKGLSEALEKYPNVFSNIFFSMIKVGEVSGNLDKSLEYLSIQLHREADLRSKTKGAMIYPAVIVVAMLIIGVLMSIFVLPNLTSVFKDFGGDLPITTKVVMVFADFMSAHAFLVIAGLIGFVIAFIAFLRTYTGRVLADNFLLRFMVINTIIKKINLARFSRILSSLLKSGIPIVQALDVAADSLDNIPYKDLVKQSAVDVKLGKPLTESLSKNENLFPVLVVQMIQVGEESGTVQEILEQLAGHYEEEVDVTLKNLSSIIEPLLLLFIGGVVGFLAMALIAPIYSISQTIQ
ncbi:MAG: type II secretion system F family protein [Candidatus Doudnabacteria bacterium]|nr:type II secretion system F family protein [Candidatus Doudnabacteria bacterium]